MNETKEGGVITDVAKVLEVAGEMRTREAADRTQRLRTAKGLIIRILRRDELMQSGSVKWWIKVKGEPATFVVTDKEYADAWFLREGDSVSIEYLVDGDPGRPTPGQKVKVESLRCELLDGGVA